jgi:hypothetical protein
MEKMKITPLFNGPIEVGLRALLLLLEAHPRPLDLQRLVILDYLMVHSGDVVNGPPSLHPPSPLRAGEVAFRRELLQQGLLLLASRGLVMRTIDAAGLGYVADDAATVMTDALTSDYVQDLRQRAAWAMETAGELSDRAASALFGQTIERWRTEFVALPGEEEM